MPRYYFDIDEGDQRTTATEAIEFPSAEAAKRSAVTALAELASDELPGHETRTFGMTIRDAQGSQIWKGTIQFASSWLAGSRSEQPEEPPGTQKSLPRR